MKKKKKKNALEELAFAASLLNPREFDLPKELQMPITFPGSDKIPINSKKSKQSSSNSNGKQNLKIIFCSKKPKLLFYCLYIQIFVFSNV